MGKISLILKREYLTRVKKKSFIIMTIVGPILMASLFVVPIWLSKIKNKETRIIGVYDKTGYYKDILIDNEQFRFEFVDEENLDSLENNFDKLGFYALMHFPDSSQKSVYYLYSDIQPGRSTETYIKQLLSNNIEKERLEKLGVSKDEVKALKPNISIETKKFTDSGEVTSSSDFIMILGLVTSLIIYMFIFLYGAQVMRGVIEEKTNRVVEVLISSVKPFELMAGKIVGIALVALTQFLLWAVLTIGIVFIAQSFMTNPSDLQAIQQQAQITGNDVQTQIASQADIFSKLNSINWTSFISVFVIFFIGGYLLYAALFAAIGSAVDNETDTQQFMLPITIPLILSIMVAQVVINDAGSQIAFWFSVIPLTSPVIMPIRVVFGDIALWEIILSVGLLIITIIGTIWLAAKIYRVGILMYGKKVNYKEIWKWIKYS